MDNNKLRTIQQVYFVAPYNEYKISYKLNQPL